MSNWLDKYRPQKTTDIIGNKSEILKIQDFLKQFINQKKIENINAPSIIISGPLGVGKTMSVDLLLKENGFEKLTTDLSDIYCKKTKTDNGSVSRSVENFYSFVQQKRKLSLLGGYDYSKSALVFDDISRITNPKKKDAIKSLIKLNNKNKKIPIIIIANDKHNKMVGELKKMISYPSSKQKGKKEVNEIHMKNPSPFEIIPLINKICKTEKIDFQKRKGDTEDINDMIIDHTQFDIRRLINTLEEIKQIHGNNSITTDTLSKYMETSRKKDIDPGIYEGTRILLNRYDGIDNALSIYCEDRSTIPLIFHENYPCNISTQYPRMNNQKKTEMLVSISKNISESDKIDGIIYSNQCWSLQPTHGFYSCAYPSYIVNKNPLKGNIYEKYAYTKDYNKTSIKKINKKVIKKTKENPLLKKMSINDFLYICTILKSLILRKDVDTICNLLAPYKFSYLKEIESIISIDKLEKGSDNEKLKTKYKIKGKMKTQIMDKLGLKEEEKNKKNKARNPRAKNPRVKKSSGSKSNINTKKKPAPKKKKEPVKIVKKKSSTKK